MRLEDIRKMPITMNLPGGGGIHESCYRAWGILMKVKQLLQKEVPHAVILEVICDLENAPRVEQTIGKT